MKSRDSNIELYRCVVMLLIVAHHYFVHSGLLNNTTQSLTSLSSIYLYLFGMWGKIGINCFVLITGYYMCMSTITIKKYLKLILEVEFYKISIVLLFYLYGHNINSCESLLISILPFTDISNSFVDCYLLFFFFIPFLNIFILSTNIKMHLRIILLCLFVFCLWPQLHLFKVSNNYIIWFVVIYLVGAFIRKYEIDKKISYSAWGFLLFISIIISCISVVLLLFKGYQWPYYFVYDCNTILAIIVSVLSFIFFKNLPLGNYKWINMIGRSTFGILLIHDSSWDMRHWLWVDMLGCTNWYGEYIYIHSILSILIVFFVCSLIDMLRYYFIEHPLFNYIYKED